MKYLLMFLLLTTAVSADNLITGYDVLETDIYEGVEDVEIQGSAGITPDSPLYAIETFIENILVGNNPERALRYKEEKILEIKAMIDSGNNQGAIKALAILEKYNDILIKEVTPEIEERVRKTSKAAKKILSEFELEDGEVKESIDENLKEEDKIALAAKVSTQIKQLCETLSDLDPIEYSKRCKTDDDSAQWKKDLDNKLTKEQEKEAKAFFGIMSECFKEPSKCRCDDISIKPFAEKCKVIAPLATKCEEGDENACQQMEDVEDPIDLLPDYLQDVMDDVEDRYGDSKHDLHIPKECVDAGETSREGCMKIMFKVHAPEPCQKALEAGKISVTNERDARKACEQIMFKEEAPQECVEAGLTSFRECERYMFKLDAPEECIAAGLTGESKNDRKQCELIRFKLDAPKECLDAGIDGSNRDDWKKCELIRFKLDAPQECIDAGITGEKRDDWKKCDLIKFKLNAPKECIDAGITGEKRDDWKKCDVIRFKLEQPKECLDAGLDGSSRNDHRECDKIRFKLDAPKECIDAGIDGSGRDDWRKCDKIKFKKEAPKECIEAGLDGSGRRDWDECNKIREKFEDKGERREDCRPGQLHICDNGYCKCIDKTEGVDCATILCPKGTDCVNGKGCVSNECSDCREKCGDKAWDCSNGRCDCKEDSECKDGCHQECPNADRTDCIDDRCKCYYDQKDDEPQDDYVDECSTCGDKCGDRGWSCDNNNCQCHDQPDDDQTGSNNDQPDNSGDQNVDDSNDQPDNSNDQTDSENVDDSNDQPDDSGSDDNSNDEPEETKEPEPAPEPEPEKEDPPEES